MDTSIKWNYILFYFSHLIQSVVLETCSQYSGGTSISRQCDSGCCENGCCTNDYQTLAIILGVIFGCLIAIFVIVLIVVCCTRERWNRKFKTKVTRKKNNNIQLTDMETNRGLAV